MWKMLLALLVARPHGRLGWMFFLLPVLRGPLLIRTVLLMIVAYHLAPRLDRNAPEGSEKSRIRDQSSSTPAEILPW